MHHPYEAHVHRHHHRGPTGGPRWAETRGGRGRAGRRDHRDERGSGHDHGAGSLRSLWASLAMATREIARSGDEAQVSRAAELLEETRRALFGLLATAPEPAGAPAPEPAAATAPEPAGAPAPEPAATAPEPAATTTAAGDTPGTVPGPSDTGPQHPTTTES